MIGMGLLGPRAWGGGRTAPRVDGSEGAGRGPWVIHPLLVGVFPIVSLYAHNVHEIPPGSLAWPIGLALLGAVIPWAGLRLLRVDSARAGLIVSVLIASFFGYQATLGFLDWSWNSLNTLWVGHEVRINPVVVLGLMAAVDALAIGWILRHRAACLRATVPLNLFALVLVALPAIGAFSARAGGSGLTFRSATPPASSGRGWTPDIYFIVLDGCARGDVMKELFGLDYEPMLGRLEHKGFFVARRSESDYCQTRLSLASTLNANYLDKLLDPSDPDLLRLSSLIRENLVMKLLRPLGYRFASFATGFEPTEIPEADLYLQPRPGVSAFHRLLIEMTPIGLWQDEVELADKFDLARGQTLFVLDRLPTLAAIRGPTFTFAHVIAPHQPFLFGEHGEDTSPRQMLPGSTRAKAPDPSFGTPEYVREAYRKQASYVLERAEETIDRILAASPEPPVIILQSDHGSFLRYHTEDAGATDLRERFGILNCILVPGRKVEDLREGMTSVNTFRAVLKEVIGADLPPLPARNYFSSFEWPLKFVDVTERLHSEAERKRTFRPPGSYMGLH